MKKISFEEAQNRLLDNVGNNIKLLKYTAMKSPAEFECQICLHIWITIAWNVLSNTTGCPECAKLKFGNTQRLTPEYVKNFIEKEKCKWISGEYKNSTSKLNIEFECGHILPIPFASFRVGCRCRICAYKIVFNNQRKSSNDIINYVQSYGFLFIDFVGEYINSRSEISYQCPKGHITIRKYTIFRKNPNCAECEKERLFNEFRGSRRGGWKGGITVFQLVMRGTINDWKKKSAYESHYICVICGKEMECVHHLMGFNLLLQQAIEESGIDIRPQLKDYVLEELVKISDILTRIHNQYIGVALDKNCHKIFHNYYGHGNNTPEQFEEFKSRIASGEIII
jgi:hypothetical protein